ncbi:acyltransferase family-domain-containing protein [Limtongia smithiae]|uniref:acyltransferase family-domain-containing protein n=1 Tax=Limtongia smithiae TaxID=1125753 RepID=UPI0034CDEAE1
MTRGILYRLLHLRGKQHSPDRHGYSVATDEPETLSFPDIGLASSDSQTPAHLPSTNSAASANNGKSNRVGALEGLRGVAAMQVTLLHYVLAFLPSTHYPVPVLTSWEHLIGARAPLNLLVDGATAVYVFFLLSGAVLTVGFSHTKANWVFIVLRRIVRLGLPVIGAEMFAFTMLFFFPDDNKLAAKLSGSKYWLARDFKLPESFTHYLRAFFVNGLFTGYVKHSVFDQWPAVAKALQLEAIISSFDTPLWTLHYEFYGSLVVLLLCVTRRHSRWLHIIVIVAMIPLFGGNPLVLFLIGHLLSSVAVSGYLGGVRGTRLALAGQILSAVLIPIGSVLCVQKDWAIITALREFCIKFAVMQPQYPPLFQSLVGALMTTTGVFMNPLIRWCLALKFFNFLGQYSFSVYLTHFPLLATVISLLYARVFPKIGPTAAFFVALAVGMATTFVAAYVFERFVDQRAVALSRRIGSSRTSNKPVLPVIVADAYEVDEEGVRRQSVDDIADEDWEEGSFRGVEERKGLAAALVRDIPTHHEHKFTLDDSEYDDEKFLLRPDVRANGDSSGSSSDV